MCLEDLAEAAVIGNESFDPEDRISDPQFILELLGSLVVVASDEYDLEDSPTINEWVVHNGIGSAGLGIIRLAHFSVKEYLTSERIVRSAVSKFALDAAMAHGQIAEACLLYLDSYQQFRSTLLRPILSSDDDFCYRSYSPIPSDQDSYPLLSYSCSFWWHLRQTPLKMQRDLDHIIWKIFHKNAAWGLPSWILESYFGEGSWDVNISPLHLFSLLGVEGAVQLELERGAHVNARNNRQKKTALHLAVRFARHHIIRLLHEYSAFSSAEDKYGFIPLAEALQYHPSSECSIKSSLAIIQLLLAHEDKMHDYIDLTSYPEKQNLPSTILINKSMGRYWITPIHLAAEYGSVEHCKLLLDRGAEINCQDRSGWNTLSYAMMRYVKPTRLKIVRFLLDNGLDVLARGDDGRTLLQKAQDDDCSLDIIKTIKERVDDAFQKYDNAALQSMETVRRDKRKAEIRRRMIEYPMDPPIFNEGDYGYDLWKEFYDD